MELDMNSDVASDCGAEHDSIGHFLAESNDDDDDSYIDTDRMAAVFNITDPPQHNEWPSVIQDFNRVTDSDNEEEYLAVRRLALYGDDDDDVTVTSDEERDILEEIKEEIKKNVITEMQGELEVYRQAHQDLQNTASGSTRDDLADLDPKMKEAILKMRKLDRILLRKMDKEKKVKRDRILLQRRLREELESLRTEGRESSLDEKKNTEKFLSLTLPASHNVGVRLDDDDESNAAFASSSFTPLFSTQPPEASVISNGGNVSRNGRLSADLPETDRASSSAGSTVNGLRNGTSRSTVNGRRPSGGLPSVRASKAGSTFRSTSTRSSVSGPSSKPGGRHNRRQKKQSEQKDKDFIKRNIELAGDAQNVIAMTDDEKKRLDDLLSDINCLPDIQEEEASRPDVAVPPPRLSLVALSEDGSWPPPDERHRLEEIDGRLKMLMPAEEFELMSSASPINITNRTEKLLSYLQSDDDRLGERFLTETKEDRAMKTRLKEIDDALQRLTAGPESQESPKLTDDTLNNLLEECARSISRAAGGSPRPDSECRALMYENPPRLDDDVLRQLLADARRSITASGEDAEFSMDVPPKDLLALEYVDADETSFPPNGNVTSVSSASRTGLSAAHAVLRAGSRSSSASATSRQSVDNSVNNNNERTTSSAATTRREPFLPSINPVGCLSTRRPSSSESRQNGERRSNAGIDRQRSSEFRTASNAWNSPTASNVWNSPAMSTDTRDASVSLPAHDIGIGSFRR